MRKYLLLLIMAVFTTAAALAQVTTSSITGTIKDGKGGVLPGATVVATHVPSGSVYSTVTRENGQYTIPNVRSGGPYTIKVTFISFTTQEFADLTVALGTPLNVDVVLQDASTQLSQVNVQGAGKGAVVSTERTGTSTFISQRAIQSLPTISRSIQDFTRLTPQAVSTSSGSDGSPLGVSFAGQNNRYNQFTIDGANSSDAFGLASNGFNGGQAGINSVPLEAIQDVQILLAPYEVTQGGFTGGGINAVTRGGTNTVHGSAYTYLTNQNAVGKNVINGAKYPTFSQKTFGASLGAPIIKNKLFFFGVFERFDNTSPLAFDPSDPSSGSKFDVNVLKSMRDFLISKYNYDPGTYTAINKEQYSTSAFARIDWNISDKHKLTVRHSYVDGSNYIISRSPTSITFSDGGYYFKSRTNSTVLELNSSFSSNSSNVLRLTYNAIREKRTTSPFPNVSITQSGLSYAFGAEFSSSANSLDQDNLTLTDNFTLYKGNHTITLGTDNSLFNNSNVFMQAYNGAYTYNRTTTGADNIAAFQNNDIAPSAYTLNYVPNNVGQKFPAQMHMAQLSVYGQDVWSVKPNFKLTYGLRLDLPVYFNKPIENGPFNADPSFGGRKNNQTAKTQILFSPRVGFNWDVNDDAQTLVRGGAGLFTGRIPLVWISNSYGTNGIATIRYTTVPSTLRFNYDPNAVLTGAYVPTGNTPPATEVDVTNRNFKVPQTLRSNLAVDQKLPFWGLVGTLEGVYTKIINNINYQELNVGPQVGTVTIGSSTRPWYNFVRPNTKFTNVLELTNTSAGYAYNLTAQITKPYSNGWTGSLAYTFGESFSLTDGTSSVAYSNWKFNPNVNGLNNLDVARSNFDAGSRVVGYVSKTFTYANKRLATTVGLVYSGYSGQAYSYTYSKNVTGDDVTGRNANNNTGLIYVPSDAELNDANGYTKYTLVNLTATSGGVTTITRTAAQQWSDLKDFINSESALMKNKGKVIPRNGARMPWENHFDLHVAQDFFVYKQHKLSVAVDILNVGNLLSKEWGRSYGVANQNIALFTVVSQSTTPTFTFDKTRLNTVDGNVRPYFINDFTSRWRGQLSVRYSF